MNKLLTLLTALTLFFSTAWAESVSLTYKTLGLTESLTSNTEKTIDGITFVSTDLKKYNTTIYARANTGTIFNSTAFSGYISNVAITHSGTARATTIWGSYDGSEWIEVASGNGSFDADFSGKEYKHFKITRGASAAYWTKVVVTYTTGSSSDDSDEYVDLGLPSGTLWATRNIGASVPEEYGQYFAWGETVPNDVYNWDSYKWCNGSLRTMTSYCTSSEYGNNGFVDGKTELAPLDDAATVNWGPQWRMPSKAQLDELRSECTWTWTARNGMSGYLVKSNSNDKSLFLPAAGFHFGAELYGVDKNCYYWSRTLDTEVSNQANYLWFYYNSSSSSGIAMGTGARCDGFVVRAVRYESDHESMSLDKLEHGANQGEVGNIYTISDQLIAVKCIKDGNDTYLWCRDQVTSSVAHENNDPATFVDYMKVVGGFTGDWDQCNWVALKFENADLNDISVYENKFLKANTITGVYSDNNNYTITMLGTHLDTETQSITIVPNMYCPANFLQSNLNGNATGNSGLNANQHYFFVNPKIQEVCEVTFAKWNGSYFVLSRRAGSQGDSGINGAFNVDWKYNGGSIPEGLETGSIYKFKAIVQKPETSQSGGVTMLKDENNNSPDGSYIVYPIDFDPKDVSNIITGINIVGVNSAQVTGVKYYNVAGVESDRPFQGVNIVVTRYNDGSMTTTKLVK